MSKQETPEMVERVATAIKAKVPEGYGMTTLEAREYAAAAIEALMEPTEAMLRAGDRPGWDDSVTVGLALEIWQAMLRAALSQGDDKNGRLCI